MQNSGQAIIREDGAWGRAQSLPSPPLGERGRVRGTELIVDIAPDDSIYGIELLNANRQLQRENGGSFLIVNEATGEEVDVPLTGL